MFERFIYVEPRLADLDTQRHVTSRTFESFCWQARYQVLDELGYSQKRLLDEKILLVLKASYVKFLKEQQPGARLQVRTRLSKNEKDNYIWHQQILNEEEQVACTIITETILKKGSKKLIPEWPAVDNEEPFSEEELKPLATKIKKFSGKCRRVKGKFVMLYSERTPFFDYPPSALWRIFEEGRWHFSEELGLTEKKILEIDTITFFTGANFQFKKMPKPGKELIIYTWIEAIDKIRCYMRQEVTEKGSEQVLMSIREEQLIVSLQKRRPKKAPPEFLTMVKKYIEKL